MATSNKIEGLKIEESLPGVKVSAGIITRCGRVLIAQRRGDDCQALKWEFPGGKVEAGETPRACLKRELLEELGIQVQVGTLLARHLHCDEHLRVDLYAYFVDWITGQLSLRVHAQCRWVTATELSKFDFLPADVPIISRLVNGADHQARL